MPAENTNPTLAYPGGEYELSVAKASEGNDGLELGKLLATTGYTTFDPGFVNTASTKSAITFIDGENGILRYRGYPIEQLAE
ncbi:MAG: citrate (Si)-synthase, partial [Aldersonia sp.]|nr:citrate (Si)-synthase [Aldersonia sp.]